MRRSEPSYEAVKREAPRPLPPAHLRPAGCGEGDGGEQTGRGGAVGADASAATGRRAVPLQTAPPVAHRSTAGSGHGTPGRLTRNILVVLGLQKHNAVKRPLLLLLLLLLLRRRRRRRRRRLPSSAAAAVPGAARLATLWGVGDGGGPFQRQLSAAGGGCRGGVEWGQKSGGRRGGLGREGVGWQGATEVAVSLAAAQARLWQLRAPAAAPEAAAVPPMAATAAAAAAPAPAAAEAVTAEPPHQVRSSPASTPAASLLAATAVRRRMGCSGRAAGGSS